MPTELVSALREAPGAAERWQALADAHRREWAEWVRDGRRIDTRERRAAQAVMRLLQHGGRDEPSQPEDG